MSLDELMSERNSVLKELKLYEELELGLEKINQYNKGSDEKLKVYNTINYPDLEDITELFVTNRIDQLTDNLSKIYEQINNY